LKQQIKTQLNPGDRLGEYVIDELLGSGRSGTVYRGRNVNLGHAVALKVYRVRDRSSLQRFERSARLMAQIRSPNVVSLLDYWIEGGTPVMVTEYTPGQSLHSLLEHRGALPWPTALSIMREVLRGLDAIHDSNVLHRNMTPNNVIVAPGDPPVVKLTDLSLAKSMMGGSTRITVQGMVVGTPAYMSPEQILQEPVDARSDLYSAGLLLYELLTGKLPRPGNDLMALLRAIDKPLEPPQAPSNQPPLPSALVNVLGAVLQPDRGKRPMTAQDIAGMLNSVAKSTHSPAPAIPTPKPAPSAAPAPQLRLSAESSAWQKLALRSEFIGTKQRPVRPNLKASSEVVYDSALPRIRAILAGHLPEDDRRRSDASAWLKTLVPSGQNFFVGKDFWVAVLIAANDDDARAQGRKITQDIFARFGDILPVKAKMVDDKFVLPRSCVEGTSPPPFAVLGLLEQLARARRS